MNAKQGKVIQKAGANVIFKAIQKTRYPGDWHLNATDELYSMTGCHLIPTFIQQQISAAVQPSPWHAHDYIDGITSTRGCGGHNDFHIYGIWFENE